MKNWKVIIEQEGKTQTVIIMAQSYADAYIKAGTEYPRAIIMSITEVKDALT
jgi:hypothetical protein